MTLLKGQNKLDVYYPVGLVRPDGSLDPTKVVDTFQRLFDFVYRIQPVDPEATNSTIVTDGFVDQLLTQLHLTQILLTHETFFASTSVCSWNAHQLNYKNVEYQIPAGSTTNQYIYWSLSKPSAYQTSATLPTLGEDTYIIAQYNASTGKVVEVWQPRNNVNVNGVIDTGTGTTNTVPKWQSGSTGVLEDSSIFDTGTLVGVGEQLQLANKITAYNNVAPTDGQLLIGSNTTSAFEAATLIAGSNVTITNGHGSITIAASGVTLPVSIANGGTGQTTASAARTALQAAASTAVGSHTITLAKLTGGGANGSITWNADGSVASFVDPT